MAVATVLPVRSQEIGYRDFGGRVDSEPVPAETRYFDPDISTWEPSEEFADEMIRIEPAISMSSLMKVEQRNAPRHIVVMPNRALRIWRLEISNGSAGNWGSFPNSYLDARTLSFPTP